MTTPVWQPSKHRGSQSPRGDGNPNTSPPDMTLPSKSLPSFSLDCMPMAPLPPTQTSPPPAAPTGSSGSLSSLSSGSLSGSSSRTGSGSGSNLMPPAGHHDHQRVTQLVDIWQQIRAALTARKAGAEKSLVLRNLVKPFVATYNPRWAMWNTDLYPTLWDGTEHSDKPPISSIPPLDSTLVRAFVKSLKEFTVSFSQAVATASQNRVSTLHPLALEFPHGLEIVCLFSILSRTFCNIQELFSEDDTLYCFSKIIKLVTVCITSLPDVQGKGGIEESDDIYLQVILGYSFRTMECLLSRDHGWKRYPYETPEARHAIQQCDDEQCYVARINMPHIGSLLILLKKTLELLSHQGSSQGFCGSRYHLLCHILNLIGALSFRNPAMIAKILECRVLETLLVFLPGSTAGWFSLTDPQYIFNIQLLVFQVLGFSFGPSPELAFRFASAKGWQSYFQLLAWVPPPPEARLPHLPASHQYIQNASTSSASAAVYLPSVHDFLPVDSESDQAFLSQFFRHADDPLTTVLPLPPRNKTLGVKPHLDLLIKTLSVVCTNTSFASGPPGSNQPPSSSHHHHHPVQDSAATTSEDTRSTFRRLFGRSRRDPLVDHAASTMNASDPGVFSSS